MGNEHGMGYQFHAGIQYGLGDQHRMGYFLDGFGGERAFDHTGRALEQGPGLVPGLRSTIMKL